MKSTLQKIPKTASMREVQRNYRSLFDWVKKTNKPLILTSGSTPYVVVLNIGEYQTLVEHMEEHEREAYHLQRHVQWEKIEKNIKMLRQKGDTQISLSNFIIKDREHH